MRLSVDKFKIPLMRCGDLLDNQQPKSMPQIKPLICTFHIMRLFLQLVQLFLRQTYSVIRNRQDKLVF